MKTEDFISNSEKRSVRVASKDISIWQQHNDAVPAASKNIRARVI